MIISKLVEISFSLSWYNLQRWVKVNMNVRWINELIIYYVYLLYTSWIIWCYWIKHEVLSMNEESFIMKMIDEDEILYKY